MNLLLAQSSFAVCRKRLIPADPQWGSLSETVLGPFYVPFDPYSGSHQLGQFGADFSSLSAQAPAVVPQVPVPSLEAVAAARTSAVAAQSALASLPGQFLYVSAYVLAFLFQ